MDENYQNLKSTAKFMVGATLFSPLLATEDVLRHFDVKISPHGLFRNDEGKSMLEIWNESKPIDYTTHLEIDPKEAAASGIMAEDRWDFDIRNFKPSVIPQGS